MWSGALATPEPDKTSEAPCLTRDCNIVITGFMGTGKTTVGRRVAALTGRQFIDTDDEIVRRVGMTIPQIFARDGEPRFRELERRLIRALANTRGLVIATGGGTVVNDENRHLMDTTGFLVCLDAAPDDVQRRLTLSAIERPLAANWRDLYQRRQTAYAAIPRHVNTDGKSPDQVAEEIIALWQSSFR
jgi:shikimate kinase